MCDEQPYRVIVELNGMSHWGWYFMDFDTLAGAEHYVRRLNRLKRLEDAKRWYDESLVPELCEGFCMDEFVSCAIWQRVADV